MAVVQTVFNDTFQVKHTGIVIVLLQFGKQSVVVRGWVVDEFIDNPVECYGCAVGFVVVVYASASCHSMCREIAFLQKLVELAVVILL